MPIINRIADYHGEMKEWRQHIHKNPELNFDCHKTADFVVKKLKEFGVDEIHEKIAESGRQHIIDNFNWLKITLEYEEMIFKTIQDFKNANL